VALAWPNNVIAFPQPQGKSNEWYTPSRYIEAAREVMQGIDLDPASCAVANETVKAKRYYTQAENGIVQPWYGKVWLNPPYGRENATGRFGGGRSLVTLWSTKLISEYKSGNVLEAILLMVADTDANWFQPLWEYPICFANHKIHFHRPGLSNMGQFFGTAFTYLGPNFEKFTEVFSKFGRIAKAIDTPRQTVSTPSLWEVQ
jgi:hypothetical protein